ncbi:MAG: hypothetical protein WCF84_09825 [Anaerolineae bacterium]
MNAKRWALLLALAASILWIVTACNGQGRLLAQNEPTATATRRPRPTFTPLPVETDTPVPTDTPQATDTPAPTDTQVPPTAKPTVRATAKPKPPTAIPQPTDIPPTAGPTTSPYAYRWVAYPPCSTTDPDICNIQNGVKCENSGNTRLRGAVLTTLSTDSGIAGIKVRFSYAPGGAPIDPDEVTGDNGVAEKTMSTARGGNAGSYYAWVVDSSGHQQSPFSPAMVITTKPSGDPQVCIVATVLFIRN